MTVEELVEIYEALEQEDRFKFQESLQRRLIARIDKKREEQKLIEEEEKKKKEVNG